MRAQRERALHETTRTGAASQPSATLLPLPLVLHGLMSLSRRLLFRPSLPHISAMIAGRPSWRLAGACAALLCVALGLLGTPAGASSCEPW